MIDKTISHYKILEKLGEGGMGVVYKAEDTKLKRIVAIKFLPKRLSVHGEERERFVHEAQAASALNHPNICVIHEIDEVDDESFIVMEYMDGVTLREWVRKKTEQSEGYRKLGMKEAIDLATQIAEGLEKAHEKGIIHRDVKSDNIMVTSDGRAKIMDFGLAKLKGVSKLTKTGSTVGTIAYMSPEQVEGIETDHRTDIFSFGVVIYEMLAGCLPFRAVHETAMLYEIINVDPQSLINQHKGIDTELNRIVMKCLEKDREERYQSMREVAVDLKRYKRDSEGRRIERKPDAREALSTSELTSTGKRSKTKWLKIGLAAFCVLFLISLGIYLFTPKVASIDSIAVLPFENVGADPNTEYLSDGITESIISSLSQLSNLSVMSRTSVFHYKGKDVDPLKVGKELGVKAVLVGRVTQRGDNLQISTELVDVSSKSQMWGEQYSKKISDILSIQEEISKEISRQLSLKLGSEEEKKLTKRSTENAEAYQLYLKGRFYWNKRTADDLQKAVDYFRQAIEKDPYFALAYAGLASTYALLPEYAGLPAKDLISKAEAAAKKALELDATLAEPHAALGMIKNNYQWDWEGAEKEFKQAIKLDPKNPTAHHWYSNSLTEQGKLEEAMFEIKRAQELDPLSPVITVNVGEVLFYMRHYDLAIEQFNKALELDRNFPTALVMLGDLYAQQNKFVEAISELQKVRQILPTDNPYGSGELGYVYAKAGKKDEAIKILNRLLEFSNKGNTLSVQIAYVYIGLGDKDKAFEWLEKGYSEQNDQLAYLKVEPIFDNLRSDPKYAAMLKKIGLIQ
jgi:serine/threonine protein kinase/Flp pilus assembly protein TadD